MRVFMVSLPTIGRCWPWLQWAVQPPSTGSAVPVMEAARVAAQEDGERAHLLDGGEALGRLVLQEHVADHRVAGDVVRLAWSSICFSTSGVQT